VDDFQNFMRNYGIISFTDLLSINIIARIGLDSKGEFFLPISTFVYLLALS
jgi:hypothetical protein